jgi:hypothetical protein
LFDWLPTLTTCALCLRTRPLTRLLTLARPLPAQIEPFASITPLACGNQASVLHWLEGMITHHAHQAGVAPATAQPHPGKHAHPTTNTTTATAGSM